MPQHAERGVVEEVPLGRPLGTAAHTGTGWHAILVRPCPRDRLLMPPIATRGARDRPGGGHLLRDAGDQAAGRVPRRQLWPGAPLAGAPPGREEAGEERGVVLAIVGVMGSSCALWRRWWGAAKPTSVSLWLRLHR